MNTGILYVVATPIGNLEDITYRAIRILQEADYILCEDTRVTGKLLKHYAIDTKMNRYDAHASDRVHEQILTYLADGKHVALVSDAGTPGVSDPGVLLVQKARAQGCRIETIPGPSAVTAAVSVAGLTGNQFTFLGFAPQKKGRETFFKSLASYEHPVVFFESTHRIMKAVDSLAEHMSNSPILVMRELTKLHEETLSGTANEIKACLEAEPVKQKGEFVIIADPR
tara:strand:- start:617 stop:1294 length:678 start_codon:yes stop_codon:yes gene_type:complete